METPTTDDIWSRLHRYETAVQETRDHVSECSSFGRYRVGAPYFEQYPLRAALDSVEEDGVITGALAEYERITRELESFASTRGQAFREELCCDLLAYTEAYRTMLCYHELGMDCDGEITDSRIREEIGILLWELRNDFPTDDIEWEISLLDNAFHNTCETERTGNAVTVGTDTPGGATVPPDLPWQQYPSSRRQKERAGFR
ncbi:MAG: hypothetical protein ABFC78_09905 [Methanoregula sp.]